MRPKGNSKTLFFGKDLDFSELNTIETIKKRLNEGKLDATALLNKYGPMLSNFEEEKDNLKDTPNFQKREKDLKNRIGYLATIVENQGKGLKVMTPDQMLQRLPVAIAQVEAGNNSRSLANEIRQMLYSLLQSGKITKKFYEGLMKTI